MPDAKWFGQMSLLRELSLKDGVLIQKPVREIDACRTNEVIYENERISGRKSFPELNGRKADIELTVNFKDGEGAGTGEAQKDESDREYACRRFEFRFAEDSCYYSSISYTTEDSMLRIDRTFSGSRRDVIHHRKCRTPLQNGILKLRIILDLYSVEVFVNDGSQTVSAVLYTDPSANQISFSADGEAVIDVRKYNLTADE